MITITSVGVLIWTVFPWLMLLLGAVTLTSVAVIWRMLSGDQPHGEPDDTHQAPSDIGWLTGQTQSTRSCK